MEQIRGLETHGSAIIGTGVLFTVLSVAAVGLRFTSKRMTKSLLGIDDWLLLASLAIFVTTEILVIRGERYQRSLRLVYRCTHKVFLLGDIIGRKATSVEDERYKTYLRYVYIYSAFTFPIVALAQASLLFLYRRVFFPSHLRYTSMILVGIITAWLIAASTIEIGYPGHTIGNYFPGSAETKFNIDYLSFWLAMAIIETLIEIIIIVLPIREIQRLKLNRKSKHGLSLIFSLGGFVVITNIIRMSIIYRPTEPEFDLTEGNIWLNVHFGTAIISACLPTYKPLISRSVRMVSHVYASHGGAGAGGYIKNGTRNSEDTRNLRSDKDSGSNKMTANGYSSRQLREEISMDQMTGGCGFFADARRSESNYTSKREWRDEGAIQAGAAIGVRQTIEVV
ncbi:MAG: hypothetical protein Q9182_003011 [Xanthomendoza sp. 2 TL-2023]